MAEEQAQLARGDIPYFFKLMGRSELCYYTSADWDYAHAAVTAEKFKSIVSRAAVAPDILLNEK